VPELAENSTDTTATLFKVNPALGEGVARAATAWPRLIPPGQLFGAHGMAVIADDAMLLAVLETTSVRDLALERFLTSVRAAVLERVAEAPDDADGRVLGFYCALARQCFNNEYVFAEGPDEVATLERQTKLLIGALDQNAVVQPLQLAALASYRPLSSLPDPRRLLNRAWPDAVDRLLTQQIREVEDERRARDAIPRLTAITGEIETAVRRQYEENPYPRWIVAPSPPIPMTVDEYL